MTGRREARRPFCLTEPICRVGLSGALNRPQVRARPILAPRSRSPLACGAFFRVSSFRYCRRCPYARRGSCDAISYAAGTLSPSRSCGISKKRSREPACFPFGRRSHLKKRPLSPDRTRRWMRWAMSTFYCVAGILHLRAPNAFLPIMPDWVPMPREVVLFTGVCEIVGAVALMTRSLRWWAG